MAEKDALGRTGEQLAVEFLVQRGYAVVERNWRCRQGEIDIVARHRGTTVFVEVKTRSGLGYGHPFEALSLTKLARLRRLAGAWCEAHPEISGDIRIDAIAVLSPPRESPIIEHLEAVFA
ncbi:MAG: YraN family protein [Actinomycetales bacterium]|nr:YraN family protein [Actinomycetales bacterium]